MHRYWSCIFGVCSCKPQFSWNTMTISHICVAVEHAVKWDTRWELWPLLDMCYLSGFVLLYDNVWFMFIYLEKRWPDFGSQSLRLSQVENFAAQVSFWCMCSSWKNSIIKNQVAASVNRRIEPTAQFQNFIEFPVRRCSDPRRFFFVYCVFTFHTCFTFDWWIGRSFLSVSTHPPTNPLRLLASTGRRPWMPHVWSDTWGHGSLNVVECRWR